MRNLPLRVQNLLGLLIVRAGGRGGHSLRTTFRQPFVTPFQAIGFAERLSANVAFQMRPLHLGDGKFPLTRSGSAASAFKSCGATGDGGTGKGGQNGREKGASTAVTLWPTLEVTMPVTSEGEISGGRILQRFRLLRTIGLAFDLQDDRSLYQAVEERHCQRTVR